MWLESDLKPFNSRDFGDGLKRFKRYNSPAAIATELFKPSTDSASLLFSLGEVTKKASFWIFDPL